jgi:hypothetical protein
MARPKGYETKIVKPDSMVKKGGKVPVSSNVGPVRPPAGGSKPPSGGSHSAEQAPRAGT